MEKPISIRQENESVCGSYLTLTQQGAKVCCANSGYPNKFEESDVLEIIGIKEHDPLTYFLKKGPYIVAVKTDDNLFSSFRKENK